MLGGNQTGSRMHNTYFPNASNAGWWANGHMPDSDFIKGIQYLASRGIITVT